MLYLWVLFCELSSALPVNGMAAPTVTWSELRAWRKEMGVQLAMWEKRVLIRLGNLRASILSERQESKPAHGA